MLYKAKDLVFIADDLATAEMLSLLLQACVLLTGQLYFIDAVDERQLLAIENDNCTHFIAKTTPNETQNYPARRDLENFSYSGLKSRCPPWYYQAEGSCIEGNHVYGIVNFQSKTGQVWLQQFYCMTTDHNSTDVLGGCMTSAFGMRIVRSSFPIPCNISQLNEYMCAGLNREGQLCGQCVKGFAPPVYSYSLSCVNCTDHHLNWLRYIGVAFGPLTLFCLFICFFHISATSPYLHGFVFFSQILTSPTVLRIVVNDGGYLSSNLKVSVDVKNTYISILSVWNLDFFRTVYKPFCLHPEMTVVQALSLNYLVALYPLMLLFVTFSLVKLHERNVRLIVFLWKPFRALLRSCLNNLNINNSLVQSFATLYFLSAMKIQSVSMDLLAFIHLFYANGTHSQNLYLYLAGDVEYFGRDHFFYGLLASFFLVVFALLPTLALLLYPCRFCQRFLNKMNCNSLTLRTFMEVFQGNYRDGTNGTMNCRFFSAIFFCTRFILVVSFLLLDSQFVFLFAGTTTAILGFSIALVHPQKTFIHYLLDSLSLMILSLLTFSLVGYTVAYKQFIPGYFPHIFRYIAFSLPVIYCCGLGGYWIIIKQKIPQIIVALIFKKSKSLYNHSSSEHRLLLVSS